jgi:hypothetical protein
VHLFPYDFKRVPFFTRIPSYTSNNTHCHSQQWKTRTSTWRPLASTRHVHHGQQQERCCSQAPLRSECAMDMAVVHARVNARNPFRQNCCSQWRTVKACIKRCSMRFWRQTKIFCLLQRPITLAPLCVCVCMMDAHACIARTQGTAGQCYAGASCTNV